MRQRVFAEEKDGSQVDSQYAIPIFIGKVGDRLEGHHRGVVHHDIDLAPFIHCGFDGGADLGGVANIALGEDRLAPGDKRIYLIVVDQIDRDSARIEPGGAPYRGCQRADVVLDFGIANDAEATAALNPPYRQGWSLL